MQPAVIRPTAEPKGLMNTSRRTASPVRVSMAATLGGELDGAWWLRSASMARELPDLVPAVRAALGDVVDIDINWSAKSTAPVLSTMSVEMAAKVHGSAARHRLMLVTGSTANARILLVPSGTPSALALMVLRYAAKLPISPVDHSTPEYLAAQRVVRAARAESLRWSETRDGRTPAGPAVG